SSVSRRHGALRDLPSFPTRRSSDLGVTPNLDTITALPVQGLHVDLVHGKDDVAELHKRLPAEWLLSAGLVNGRNVWRADLTGKYVQIKEIVGKRELWVASSCSLLHSPI